MTKLYFDRAEKRDPRGGCNDKPAVERKRRIVLWQRKPIVLFYEGETNPPLRGRRSDTIRNNPPHFPAETSTTSVSRHAAKDAGRKDENRKPYGSLQ